MTDLPITLSAAQAEITRLRDELAARPEHEVRDEAQWHVEWQWWAGSGEEWMGIGPCPTRDDAVSEMVDDGSAEYLDETVDPPVWRNKFYICEAKQDPLRLSDWIGLDWLIDRAEENLADSERVSCEHDDGPWFDITKEQEAELCEALRKACDDWQVSHGLKFHSSTFSHTRNGEYVTTAAIRAMKGGEK